MRIEGLSFNFRLYSTGLTQITKQKQNQECFGQAKGKNENDQCIRVGFEQRTKGGCLPFLNHKLIFSGLCFKKSISFLSLRIITVLMSGNLLTSHRRWLLLWICALKLRVRETKKELMKKIVHELYLYRVISFDFYYIE